MAKAVALQGDMGDQRISLATLGAGLYGFPAEGDPNSGIIIGDGSVMVIEAQATQCPAQKVIEGIRLGMTWTTTTVNGKMSVFLGKRRIDISQLGHTSEDAVVQVPDVNVIFTRDIVEVHSACSCGDGHFGDWGNALDAIRSHDLDAIVPGWGDAVDRTKDVVDSTHQPLTCVTARNGMLKEACDPKFMDHADYENCLPFNMASACGEVRGTDHPRIWTAQHDPDMWAAFQG